MQLRVNFYIEYGYALQFSVFENFAGSGILGRVDYAVFLIHTHKLTQIQIKLVCVSVTKYKPNQIQRKSLRLF